MGLDSTMRRRDIRGDGTGGAGIAVKKRKEDIYYDFFMALNKSGKLYKGHW